jgi:hypothetical protein
MSGDWRTLVCSQSLLSNIRKFARYLPPDSPLNLQIFKENQIGVLNPCSQRIKASLRRVLPTTSIFPPTMTNINQPAPGTEESVPAAVNDRESPANSSTLTHHLLFYSAQNITPAQAL